MNENSLENVTNSASLPSSWNSDSQQTYSKAAELEQRENELCSREMKFLAKQLLTEKGLSAELAEIIRLDDEDTIRNAVEVLDRVFNAPKANESGSNMTVLSDYRLPETDNADRYAGELRRAFGLN